MLLAFCYGAFTSLQYTSMNTLVYADIPDDNASNASSIASTMQQMSISFGVAAAGLTTAIFIPVSSSSNAARMIFTAYTRHFSCLADLPSCPRSSSTN